MKASLMTQTFDSVTLFTHVRVGRQFGLAANGLAICVFLLSLSLLVSRTLEPVNINLASAKALAGSLLGVGLARAHRIVTYREAYDPFEHIDELAAVQGTGSATVEKNCSVIRLQ